MKSIEIEVEIRSIRSKLQIDQFCLKLIRSEVSIKDLIHLLQSQDLKLKTTIAWILSTYAKLDSARLQNHFKQIASYVQVNQIEAVNRNLLGCINLLKPTKGKVTIQLFDTCKTLALNRLSPLAVRVNAMYVMLDILFLYPAFYNEFSQILYFVKESEACSIQAALKHIHKTINKYQIRNLAANQSV